MAPLTDRQVPDKTNPGDPVSTLNAQQVQNVKTIIGVGKAAGVTDNGIITALAVANDESTFLNYGSVNVPGSEAGAQAMGSDHMSVGVFQQQVGNFGWGPDVKTMMDPVHQAAAFYGVTPKASAPGLLQQQDWQKADPGSLAQQVQQSGTPSAYYPLVSFAKQLLAKYGDTPPVQLPFTPKATGPLYVHHTIASFQANPQSIRQPVVVRDDAVKQGGLVPTPKAAQASAPVENSQGVPKTAPRPQQPSAAGPPAVATPAAPPPAKGPMKAM